MGTNEIRRRLAFRRRYRRLVADVVRPLAEPIASMSRRRWCGRTCVSPDSRTDRSAPTLARRQAASRLLARGDRAAAQADDRRRRTRRSARWATMRRRRRLSQRSRLFTDFFRQRFAQVTNPSVDPYREVGGDVADDGARRPRQLHRRARAAAAADRAALADPEPRASSRSWPRRRRCSRRRSTRCFRRAAASRRSTAAAARSPTRRAPRSSAAARSIILTDRRLSAGARGGAGAAGAGGRASRARQPRPAHARQPRRRDRRRARRAPARRCCSATARRRCARRSATTRSPRCAGSDPTGCDVAITRYRLALERGLRTLMSKMGVCTFSGYCGAQLFEILGLDASLVDRFFPGTASPVGGATLADIAATVLARHQRAFADAAPAAEYPGPARLPSRRRVPRDQPGGRPRPAEGARRSRRLAGARAARGGDAYETFTSHVYDRPASAIRDLIELTPRRASRRAARRGRTGRGDLPPLLRVGDVGRRAVAGDAPHDRGGDEPARRAQQQRRGRRGAGPVRRATRRQPHQAGRVGALRRDAGVPAFGRRAADQDRAGLEAGRRRPAAGDESDPAHRPPAPRAAGDDADFAAGAPRHLQHRGSRAS